MVASEAARVSRTLGEQGHWVCDLRPDERSLEDLFLEVTTGLGNRAGEPGGDDAPELEEVGR